MNCENIIKQNAYKLKTSRRDIDIAPDISHSDREKWAKKYASDLSDSNVADIILALSDTSVGSLAITGRELLFDNFGDHGLRHVAFSQIESVSSTQGGRFSPDTISLHLSDGSDVKMDGSVDGLNIDLIAAIINKAIQLSKQGELTTSNQNVSSFQLSERLKVLYFKGAARRSYRNGGRARYGFRKAGGADRHGAAPRSAACGGHIRRGGEGSARYPGVPQGRFRRRSKGGVRICWRYRTSM